MFDVFRPRLVVQNAPDEIQQRAELDLHNPVLYLIEGDRIRLVSGGRIQVDTDAAHAHRGDG